MPGADLASYRLVLVRTQFGGNLGACARVASNFDLRDIVLVKAFTSIHDSEAKKYATNAAREYLANAKSTAHLDRALDGVHAAVAFTARSGTVRNPTIELRDIYELAKSGHQVALVFGNEQDGLSGEEVVRCTHICQIPTANVHPSLNLSHAVAVVLARIFDEQQSAAETNSLSEANLLFTSAPAAMNEFHSLIDQWAATLERLGYARQDFPERVTAQIGRLLGRARLEHAEALALKEFLSRIDQALDTKSNS